MRDAQHNNLAVLLTLSALYSCSSKPAATTVQAAATQAPLRKLASAARKRAGRQGLSAFVAQAVARELEREALGDTFHGFA